MWIKYFFGISDGEIDEEIQQTLSNLSPPVQTQNEKRKIIK
jgi:hypothetical protein